MSTTYTVEDIYNPQSDRDELYERQGRLTGCLCDTDQRHPAMSEIAADCPMHGYDL